MNKSLNPVVMACSSCANPFEIVTESTATCNCGTVAGTVPSQGNAGDSACCVVSVNGKDGVVVLNINDIDLLGNQFFSNALVYAALSALAPINFNPGTGQITHLTSGVTAGIYGSSTQIPVITVDAKGHITSMNTASISSTFLSVNLQNLDALTGVGYLVKTAPNTWVFRSLQGAAGKIAIYQPAGTASNSIIDLQNGIVAPGTYGNTTQYPVITVDTYGRVTNVTLQSAPSGGGGDNWGTQVVQHDATLSGTGVIANVLKIAQQGATAGQSLIWNGSTWIPGNPALAISTGEFIEGNGSVGAPLEVDRLVKIEDFQFTSGGTTSFICNIHGNIDYAIGLTTNKNILIRWVVRIYIESVVADGYISIYTNGGANLCYKGYFLVADSEGYAVPEFLIDQSVTEPRNIFVKGVEETYDSAYNVVTSLPRYSFITGGTYGPPDIRITVDPGITCIIGLSYEVDRLVPNRYIPQ